MFRESYAKLNTALVNVTEPWLKRQSAIVQRKHPLDQRVSYPIAVHELSGQDIEVADDEEQVQAHNKLLHSDHDIDTSFFNAVASKLYQEI